VKAELEREAVPYPQTIETGTHRPRHALWAAGATLQRVGESRIALIGAAVVAFWVLVALFAPLVTAYGPFAQDVTALATPTPSLDHPFGTDLLGRDIWSRLAFGARTVLLLAPASLAVAYGLGVTIGLASGYVGGWLDTVLSRLCDVILSFPVIALYILLITVIGPSVVNILLAITVSSVPAIARIVRGQALNLRTKEFVEAARIRGERPLYIMVVELLPNMKGILIVDACLRMGYTIIKIGILGFLGLGVPPPNPDWGGMVKDATSVMLIWPHMSLIPCLAISSLAVAFNLIADGLSEISARH
jgi:peptide/nickel transport system permease protein